MTPFSQENLSASSRIRILYNSFWEVRIFKIDLELCLSSTQGFLTCPSFLDDKCLKKKKKKNYVFLIGR